MGTSSRQTPAVSTPPETVFEQRVLGARRLSNVFAAAAVSIGGAGFSLASISSYLGQEILPIVHASELTWIPQGLVMGLYGSAALLLATYLWSIIAVDLGGGCNRFDKASGLATITRNALRQEIRVDLPLRDIQAVKVEMRDGLSPLRRLALRLQGRRDLPLTRVGEPMPLAELELAGANLARFLGVPLEGL